jgi:hypothetical protein
MSENNASSRDSDRGRGRFGLGLAVGTLAGLIVARWLSAPQRMPHLTVWQRALAEKRGEAEAARLVARAQTQYNDLYARRPRPASRALRFHLERSILPGLALYQILLEKSDDRQAVLAEMDYLITSAQTGLSLGAWLQASIPFPVRRRVLPWVMRFGFPAEGWDWDLEPLQDSEDCFAYNIRRCFILDTLRSYGAPELTPAYCSLDDAMAAKLPPSITWERTMTLGRGHDRCDFRWCRAAPEVTASGARER